MRIVWVIVGAIVGFMAGVGVVVLVYLAMGAPRRSEMESSAIGNVFELVPLVGLIGLGLGIWLALRLTRRAA